MGKKTNLFFYPEDFLLGSKFCASKLVSMANLPEPDDLVLLSTYQASVDAHMAKTYLETQGIEVHLVDAYTVSLNTLYASALGGIKLVVPQRDLEHAQKLLDAVQKGELVTEDQDIRGEPCPKCQSTKTLLLIEGHARAWRLLLLVMAFLPIPFHENYQWTCTQCLNRWQSPRKKNWGYIAITWILFCVGIYTWVIIFF
jgi:hypothetical protein